ncbi:MAG: hypothetical protein S0880_09040 [Actinomycetota bacterium]|nr:hypothetical protein [Actinomycetota bacterium]
MEPTFPTSTSAAVAGRRAELMRAAAPWRRQNRRSGAESPPTALVHRVRRRPALDATDLDTAA